MWIGQTCKQIKSSWKEVTTDKRSTHLVIKKKLHNFLSSASYFLSVKQRKLRKSDLKRQTKTEQWLEQWKEEKSRSVFVAVLCAMSSTASAVNSFHPIFLITLFWNHITERVKKKHTWCNLCRCAMTSPQEFFLVHAQHTHPQLRNTTDTLKPQNIYLVKRHKC